MKHTPWLCAALLTTAAHADLLPDPSLGAIASYQDDPQSTLNDPAESSDEDQRRYARVTALWENDSVGFNPWSPSDNWYTSGARIHVSFAAEEPGSDLDRFIRAIPLLGAPEPDRTSISFALTQEFYTPTDIERTDRVTNDRPYAGWSYFSTILQRASDHQLDSLEIKLGVTGDLSGARAAQEFVHAALPEQEDPGGWGNQIDERLTLDFDAVRMWKTDRYDLGGGLSFEAIPEIGARLGTTRIDSHASVLVRVGRDLPGDFGPARLRGAWDASTMWYGRFGWYAWARAGVEAVAYDMFIDGNTPGTRMHPDREPLVGTLSAGLMGHIGNLHAGYAVFWESPRFDGQERHDTWGSWMLSWRFEF